MFNIIAHSDVTIDSFAVKYTSGGIYVQQEIWGKEGTYRTFEQNPGAWDLIGSYNNFSSNPPAQFTLIPLGINQSIATGDTFAFYLTTINSIPVNMQYTTPPNLSQEVVYKTDGVIDFVQGTVNTYFFGAYLSPRVLNMMIYYSTRAGVSYLWNTGDTTSSIKIIPSQNETYSVRVALGVSGCHTTDSVYVSVIDSSYCHVSIDEDLNSDNNFLAIPNPSSGKIFLQGIDYFQSVEVYDVKGEKVWHQSGSEKIIDLSELGDGLYLLSVNSGENIFRRKIVLLK
jgi:hypothetical protein